MKRSYEIIEYTRSGIPIVDIITTEERYKQYTYLMKCTICSNNYKSMSASSKFCSDGCRYVNDEWGKYVKRQETQSRRNSRLKGKSKEVKALTNTEKNVSKNKSKKKVNSKYVNKINKDIRTQEEINKDIELAYEKSMALWMDGHPDSIYSTRSSAETVFTNETYNPLNKADMIDISLLYYYMYDKYPTVSSKIITDGFKFYFKSSVEQFFGNSDAFHDFLDFEKRSYNSIRIKECLTCHKIFHSEITNYPDFCSYECCEVSGSYNLCNHCGVFFKGVNGYQKYCSKCEEDGNSVTNFRYNYKALNNTSTKNIVGDRIEFAKNSNDIDQYEENVKNMITVKISEIIEKSRMQGSHSDGQCIDYWKVGGFTESIKDKVRDRDNNICQICDKETDLHIHHIVPRRNGGSHDLDNLILLCSSCHMAIETNNIEHAIKKCTNNVLKNSKGFVSFEIVTDDKETTISKLTYCLEDIFEELSEMGGFEDILLKINNALDSDRVIQK